MPSDDAWTDVPSHIGNEPCIVCDKPTRSHAIYLLDEGGAILPGSEDDNDLLLPVCHTCYEEHDGDATAVAEDLTERTVQEFGLVTEAGLTPGVIAEIGETELEETERVKALGEKSADRMARGLEPGDVFTANEDNGPWLAVPTKEDMKHKLPHTLIVTIVGYGDTPGAGGVVLSEHTPPRPYVAKNQGEDDDLEFEPIESLEIHGHKDIDEGILDA